MTFLRQAWYAAAWPDEVVPGTPLARTIIGEPVLLWRGTSGTLSALADKCPHRSAPLSLGHQQGDGLRCNYHGLMFDTSGACIENPHGPVLSSLCARSYPLVEKYRMLWIWMGDPEGADPAKIPDYTHIDTPPDTARSKGYMHVAASHKLLEDNILDISHADFMHPNVLGGGSSTRTKQRVEEQPDWLMVEWRPQDEVPLPVFAPLLGDPGTRADMWTEVFWHPNGAMLMHAGATVAGRPEEEGLDTWNAHIMTPETEFTTHYFYCNTREYMVDDAELNAGVAMGFKYTFEHEDRPMIEGQQARIGRADLFDTHPHLLPIDGASTRARRIFDRLLAEEIAATTGR